MNVLDEMNEYGNFRKSECIELESRLDILMKNIKHYKNKVHWASTVSPEERINIGMENIRDFENQLQMITQNVVNIEKLNARIEVLRDMRGND